MNMKNYLTAAQAERYTDEILEKLEKLMAIDSPSGYTDQAAKFLVEEFRSLGYPVKETIKGGIVVDLGGVDKENGLLLAAHTDTLGAMVHKIKGNGRLQLLPIGGLHPENTETENCRIYTRFDGSYEGTYQLCNASLHVNKGYDCSRSWNNMEVVLDEDVTCAEDTKKLGIMAGDIVCFDPRFRVTAGGYIKSRFLDDKLSVATLIIYAKFLHDYKLQPARQLYFYITVFEEVGHGLAAGIPDGVKEIISVDMGCVGEGLNCTERQVSICAKDSRNPYSYDVVTDLIRCAKENELDFAVDVYPYYGSDADVALESGHDVRYGLIGAGVYASHGYERSHRDGVRNTFLLTAAYCTADGQNDTPAVSR